MKQRKFTKRSQEINIEDIFLDKLAKSDATHAAVSERKLEVPLKRVNFFCLLLFGIFVFGVLATVTFRLQVYGKEEYSAMAEQNKYINFNLTSERGVIYDRNNNQLVYNEASFDLWLTKSELPEDNDGILREISFMIDKPLQELAEEIATSTGSIILIKKDLNHRALILLETKKDELPGFRVKKRILRHYQELASLGHILGYLGKMTTEEFTKLAEKGYEFGDSIGKDGVERMYEQTLKEKKGQVQVERTAKGTVLSQQVVEYPKSGNSLVLALDLDLQKKVEAVLQNTLKDTGSKKGAVVVLDPNNGEVLSSVSLPGFDNNLFSGGISFEDFKALNENPNNPQLNRVTSGYYPAGSTIKPFIALGALSEGLITENTSIYAPLELCIPHLYTQEGECFRDHSYHGWTDVKRAIAESVNPFFYIIGGGYTRPPYSSEFYDDRLPKSFEGLGVRRIKTYLDLFGFGETTNIDLPSEVKGRVPTPEWKENYFSTAESQKWYLGDTYNLSIGQGYLLSTPLQLAIGISAIANDGKLVEPRIVKEIVNPQTGEKEEISGQHFKEVEADKEILGIIRRGMRQTVSSGAGSARRLNDLSVNVAAKTGTAQIYPRKEIYHNWIAAFAPYENPEVVIVVLIEEVEGLQVAAQSTAKEILKYYFNEETVEIVEED